MRNADKTQYPISDDEAVKKLKDREERCFAFSAQRIEFPENQL